MAQQANEEIWDSIVITPCYEIYDKNRHARIWMLHALWDEYTENYLSPDIEFRIQGWQGVMALVRIFHERKQWDHVTYGPYPLHSNIPEWKRMGFEPKTPEWMAHWIACPEEQASMSKHACREGRKIKCID